MPQSFAALYCHIVISTKNREPVITPELQPRLYAYIGGTLRESNNVLLAAGGIADHVHLLVSLSREASVAVTVREVKANSSRWIHETFAEQHSFAWQTGYGAFSVSCSQLEVVKTYLANQERHHRRKSFQQEFISFLRRHGLEYDERYIWE
jgi:REP element-mobilizing transposase RayT